MKNPLEAKVQLLQQSINTSSAIAKAQKLYAHKSFYERWKGFNLACIVVSFLCNVFSPITAFAFFYGVFLASFAMMGSWGSWVALVFGLGAVIAIEFLKRYSVENALVDIFNYKKAGLSMLLAIFCTSASIYTSFKGAQNIPSHLATQPSPIAPKLTNVSSIDSTYNSKIQAQKQLIEGKKKELKQYGRNNAKIGLTAPIVAIKNKMQSDISTMEGVLAELLTAQIEAIREAEATNKSEKLKAEATNKAEAEEHNGKIEAEEYTLGAISIILELLFWASYWFSMYFYKMVELEAEATTPQQPYKTPKNEAKNHSLPQPTQPLPIGYNSNKNGFYNGYTIEENNGVKTVRYNGKLYTTEGVNNNINANKSKVRRYKQLGDEERRKRYTTNLQKWEAMKEALE